MLRPLILTTLVLTVLISGLIGVSMAIGRILNVPILAFSADADLWMVDLTFSVTRQLTQDRSITEDAQFSWSPDGLLHIIYVAPGADPLDSLPADALTGAAEILLRRTAYYPSLSPDGMTLAAWFPAFEGYALSVWTPGMVSPQPLTRSYPNPLPFAWRNDGSLTLAVGGENGRGLLLQIDPATGQETLIFRFPSRIDALAWRP